ncbi:unnamed protein product [Paramecium primaurelia]|uniref:G domain-containing protein n=1 Tax=Paramecium primaurelia TaxID=5886 RepID=A0A8S1PD06_PARPR|nr:unnamed protein product [Paramecium primaurelia]
MEEQQQQFNQEQSYKEAKDKLNDIVDTIVFITMQNIPLGIPTQIGKQQAFQNQEILLFLGFDHSFIDPLYSHYSGNKIIQDHEYIKIVELKIESKQYYLINSPFSLEGIKDQKLCRKQCVTRLTLKSFLETLKEQKFHVIVNFEKLQGENNQTKLNSIIDFGLLNFGQFVFKDQMISLIFENNNFQEVSHCFAKDLQQQNLQISHYLKEQFLRLIVQKDKFYKPNTEKEQNYGIMTLFLSQNLDDYANSLTNILRRFQDLLLSLQQIPCLEDEQELNKSLIQYLDDLDDVIQKNSNEQLKSISQLFRVIDQINQKYHHSINKYLKSLNYSNFKKFLKEKNISVEDIEIPYQLVGLQQISYINNFFEKYISEDYLEKNINEVKNLCINIKCWKSCCQSQVERIIYNFLQIIKEIQDEPNQQREVGVFVFGKSKVGKSTFLNLIKDPECLTIEKRLSNLCYGLKEGYQSEFEIGHGYKSKTQKVSGIQMNDIWFYDCPGFDDNISEEIRIAHRISLYNHLIKTKIVIGFILVDSSINNLQIIKDTLDPFFLLLKDRNQLTKENNMWASLVLVKPEQNTRKDHINQWDDVFQGLLEGKYSFYQEMYGNDNQCIEFPKPKKEMLPEQILFQNQELKRQILQIINDKKQQQQQQQFQLKFELSIEFRIFYQYENVLQKLQIKIEQIVSLLIAQIDQYVLKVQDPFDEKKNLFQNLQSFMVDEINQENVKEILENILEWCQLNKQFKYNSQFLQSTINDVLDCLKIEKCFKNTQISPIKVNTQKINKNVEQILKIIKENGYAEFVFDASLMLGTIALVIYSAGTAFLGAAATKEMIQILAIKISKQVAKRAALLGLSGAGLGTSFIIHCYRQGLLKWRYENYLRETEQNRQQPQRN